jgi:hypothetical protein
VQPGWPDREDCGDGEAPDEQRSAGPYLVAGAPNLYAQRVEIRERAAS